MISQIYGFIGGVLGQKMIIWGEIRYFGVKFGE